VLDAVVSHAIRPADVSGPLFVVTGSDPATNVVARRGDGTCVFLERHAGCLCAIHRTAGAQALPSACRHFPREVLIDAARGILISLSHFCPTAAGLLFSAGSLEIVEARPPLRIEPPLEGLDGTEAIAPLVRPGLLSDPDGYDAWERAGLRTLSRSDCTPDQALDLIAAATEQVRRWKPNQGPLASCVATAFRELTPPAPGERHLGRLDGALSLAELCAAHFPPEAGPVPELDNVWGSLVEPSIAAYDAAIRNYLGARLFGNWMAYEGRGMRSILAWLRMALAVFRNELARRSARCGSPPERADVLEAFRATDLLLLHTIDSDAIACTFASLEGPEPA